MAGYQISDSTTSNYLYNCYTFWTSSPDNSYGELYVFAINDEALYGEHMGSGGIEMGMRPLINLKADVEFTINDM